MRNLLIVFFIQILFSGECHTQRWPDSIDISPFGNGIRFFQMGKPEGKKFSVKLAIRKDTLLSNSIPLNHGEHFQLQNPYVHWWYERDYQQQFLTAKLSTDGTTETDEFLKVDPDFLNHRVSAKSLLALGNVTLNSRSKLNVKDLYLIPEFGRPNTLEFQNLESLIL